MTRVLKLARVYNPTTSESMLSHKFVVSDSTSNSDAEDDSCRVIVALLQDAACNVPQRGTDLRQRRSGDQSKGLTAISADGIASPGYWAV